MSENVCEYVLLYIYLQNISHTIIAGKMYIAVVMHYMPSLFHGQNILNSNLT